MTNYIFYGDITTEYVFSVIYVNVYVSIAKWQGKRLRECGAALYPVLSAIIIAIVTSTELGDNYLLGRPKRMLCLCMMAIITRCTVLNLPWSNTDVH